MRCACSGNRSYISYIALVYYGRHDGLFGKWEYFPWNVLDFFILTFRTCTVKLVSLRKDRTDIIARVRAARSAMEISTEDVCAKVRIYSDLLCGYSCNCGTREKPCKNRVSCFCVFPALFEYMQVTPGHIVFHSLIVPITLTIVVIVSLLKSSLRQKFMAFIFVSFWRNRKEM